MLIHTSEKPYMCKLCKNWSCVSLANLKKHNSEVHGNIDFTNSNCDEKMLFDSLENN